MGSIEDVLRQAEEERKRRLKEQTPFPYVAPKQKYDGVDSRIVAISDPESYISEEYRSLRTIILSFSSEKQLKKLLITSSGRREGKTITAINLAVTLSQASDLRVLLLDCDLRRSAIHYYCGLNRSPGLSEILTEGLSLNNVLQKTKMANLRIITSGKTTRNPSELLGSSQMITLLNELERKYDFIIIDTTPVISVTDAAVVGPLVDGAIMVVRSRYTQREKVSHAESILNQTGVNLIGFILTHVKYYLPKYLYRYLHYRDYSG